MHLYGDPSIDKVMGSHAMQNDAKIGVLGSIVARHSSREMLLLKHSYMVSV